LKNAFIFLSFSGLFFLAQKESIRYDPLELQLIGATQEEPEISIEITENSRFVSWKVLKARIPDNSQHSIV